MIISRAKFYSIEDLSNGVQLSRAEHVLDNYQEGKKYSDVNDVLELYNVKLLLEHGLSLKSWSEETLAVYHLKTKDFGRDITAFFQGHTDFVDVFKSVDIVYKQDIWDVIDVFGLFKSVTTDELKTILKIEPDSIENILRCERFVKKYDNCLGNFLMTYPNATCLLLHSYLITDSRPNSRTLYIPKSLSVDQKRQIVENYLNSGNATLNDVRVIMQAKDVPEFSLTPKIKLQAKRLEAQLSVIKSGNLLSGIQTGVKIEFSEQKGLPRKDASLDGLNINYVYSEEYLDTLDDSCLWEVFANLFEYLDEHGLLQLCYNRHEDNILERIENKRLKGFYTINLYFRLKNSLAVNQLVLFGAYLRRKGNSLESFIKKYYEVHIKRLYGYPSMPLNFAKDDETFVNKNKIIAPEIEAVVKQYNLFVEEGKIDAELFQLSSPLQVTLCKSLLWGKHKYVVWGDNCQESQYAMILLFSDQKLLGSVEPFKDKNYHTLHSLLTDETSVKYSKYASYQRSEIDYLIKEGYLVVNNDTVQLTNNPRIEILEQLFKKDEIVYHCHSKTVRTEIDAMVNEGILKYDDYLLSPKERHYVNFYLNNSEYSNGMQLRNKYSHGNMSCLDSDSSHQNAYYCFLMIFIIILLKIRNDLDMAKWLSQEN